jgi:hypothetical protein
MIKSRESPFFQSSFSSELLRRLSVWIKAAPITGLDSATWRQDAYGSIMLFDAYGDVNSAFGWEIDHITPKASGGGDDVNNLQALHWKNNRAKADRNSLEVLRALLSQRKP